ncbi:MAG: ABC transporter ATP-binding protein [Bdellovibrionota bacterium]
MSKTSEKIVLQLILFHRLRFRFLILFASFGGAFFGILAPYFQKEFIDVLTGETQSKLHFLNFLNPWAFIGFSFLSYLMGQAFSLWTSSIGAREAIYMQRLLSEKLYRKTLTLKVDTLSQKPLGEIVQIYAADIQGSTVFLDQTLPTGTSTLFPLILAPFILILMFDTPLWPTFLAMFIVATLNTSLAFRQSKYFFLFKKLAGERIGVVNEWIQNIRILRVLNWTRYFEKMIYQKRIVETENRIRMLTNGQIMNSITSCFTFLLNVLTLGVLVFVSKQKLTSGEILALMWILGVFLTRPFRQMPWFFTFAFDAWTSVKRLQDFFNIENYTTQSGSPDFSRSKSPLKSMKEDNALEVQNLNLNIHGHTILQNISMSVRQNEFVAVVGDVGSGKSLLLLSLLGETGSSSDFLKVKPGLKLSYVPQEGFIMSANLRENVIFDYDQDSSQDKRVLESLKSCEFHLDQERTSDGLNTEIGERGVNLSGGQKQRVSLARVDYHNADILLLDDCFSALDVDTEKLIMEKLVLGRWKMKTKILVTHRLSVIEKADRIFFLDSGKIIDEGTFDDLIEKSVKFRDFTQSVHHENTKEIHVAPSNSEGN